MEKRVWFGALAAMGAAGVAGDAWANATNYPLLHKLFGEDWNIARNLLYIICSLMAATFGYLALHVNGKGTNGKTKE